MNAIKSDNSNEMLIWVLAIVSAIGAGLVAITGNIKLIGLIFAVVVGSAIAVSPAILFWVAVIGSLIVVGLVRLYLPEFQLVRWMIAPVSALLLVHALIHLWPKANPDKSQTFPAIITLGLLFIVINLFSSLINTQDIVSAVIGFKGYFQIWGLLFALAFIQWKKTLIDSLPKLFVLIAICQIPFVIHQFVYIVPTRYGLGRGIVPVDIVAGTFGASLEAGGANAVLALYMLLVWSGAIALWKNAALSTTKTLFISAVALAPVLINEAKVSVIYLVVAAFIVNRKGLLKNPARFIGMTLLSVGLVASLFAAFIYHAPEGEVESWSDLIEYTYNYNIAKDENFEGGLSRGGALKFWVQESGNMMNTLIGYGMGVSRVSENNEIARQLGITSTGDFGVGNTAVSAILWESGLIGFGLVTAMFFIGFKTAVKLEKVYSEDSRQSALFLGLQAAMVLLYISLWHKNFFVFHIGYQTIAILAFGYLSYWQRQSLADKATTDSL
ncbi:MAG: hypothetical protein V3V12_09465 [Gammaproteobacteria bacterium]